MARNIFGDEEDDYQDPADPLQQPPGIDYGDAGFTTNMMDPYQPEPTPGGPLPDTNPAPSPAPSPAPASTGTTAGADSVNHGPPAGVSQAQWDTYLQQNPGDFYRGYHTAFTDDNRPKISTVNGVTHGPTGYGAGGTGGSGGAGGTGNANMDALLQVLMERITGTPASSSYQSPLRDQVLAQLSSLITEGSKPTGDVSQSPEALAFRGAQDRGASDMRSALMERRAAQGINLGGNNIEPDIMGIEQEKAQAQAQFEAKLSHDLLVDKKDRLERALNLGAGIISDEQRAYAQQQLSQVNSAIALFQALQSNQYNYDYLGYLLGSQEAGANASSVNNLG